MTSPPRGFMTALTRHDFKSLQSLKKRSGEESFRRSKTGMQFHAAEVLALALKYDFYSKKPRICTGKGRISLNFGTTDR